MDNLSVVKANDLIDASYRMNANAQKLVLCCIAKIDTLGIIPNSITITTEEYSKLVGTKNVTRDLYKSADALFDAAIYIQKHNERVRIRWISKDITTFKGEGAVTIYWSKEVLPYITCLTSRFTSYKLREIGAFKSAHTIRLYELIMKFKKSGVRRISLEDFKSALGVSDLYPLFSELKRRVITPSVKEINKHSTLDLHVETIKKNRAVTELIFGFVPKA